MFGSWFKDKTIGDPVKQLPQIGELLKDVSEIKDKIKLMGHNFDSISEFRKDLEKLNEKLNSICPHKHTKLYDKGVLKWEDHFLLTGQDIRIDQYRYGKKCNVCDHETIMTKLEYLRAQKELIESSIKENEQ